MSPPDYFCGEPGDESFLVIMKFEEALMPFWKLACSLVGDTDMRKGKPVDKDRELAERLPLIRCECGVEILLLPDLKIMQHAIEVHADYHKKKEKDDRKKAATAARIRQILVEQLLKRASEMDPYHFELK